MKDTELCIGTVQNGKMEGDLPQSNEFPLMCSAAAGQYGMSLDILVLRKHDLLRSLSILRFLHFSSSVYYSKTT